MKPFLETLKKQPSTEIRLYLLNYVARSLFDGLDYTTLFTLLDDKGYKRAKLEYDPSTTLYARDLDFGRRAAAAESWGTVEQINHLPHLWRYTLLRCSLTSRVDAYPDAAFLLLLRLGHQEQAERSAGLLTNAAHRARIFSLIGSEYALQPRQVSQSMRLFEQAYVSAQSIDDKRERNNAFRSLSQACIQGNQFSLARRVILSIEDTTKRTEGLQALCLALTKTQQWEPAREVIALLEDNKERNTALNALAQALVPAGEWQLAWEVFTTIEDSAEKAQGLIAFGVAVAQVNDLQTALQIWREALRILLSKEDIGPAIGELTKALISTGEQEAVQLYMELKEGITSIKTLLFRETALYKLCQPWIQWHVWTEVMEIIGSMQTAIIIIRILSEFGQALVAFSEELMQAGEEEDAATFRDLVPQIWHAIRKVIATLEGSTKATALDIFGESLMKAHLEQEALQAWRESRDIILASAHDDSWDTGRLSSLSKKLAQAGHGEEALNILRAIEDSEKREKEYYELLKVLLATQQWQSVRNVSRTIQHSPERYLEETYQALIQAHEWRQALEVIEEMRHAEGHRKDQNSIDADVLRELRKVLAQARDAQDAAQLWQEMQGIFVTIPITNSEQRNELRELVKVLAQSEQWEAARGIVQSVHGYTEESVTTREFCQILAQAHHWQEAREIAANIWEDSEQARALSELGLELVAVGQRQEAHQAWQETQQVLVQTVSEQQRARALRHVSLGLAQARKWEDALQITQMIEDYEEAAGALGEVAGEKLLFGDKDLAAKIWQTVHSTGANSPSLLWQVCGLNGVGLTMVQVGREQEAQKVWQETQKVIASIQDTYWQRRLTDDLVQQKIQAGQWREVQGMYGSASSRVDVDKELGRLGTRLIQANRLQEAREIQKMLTSISDSWQAKEIANNLSHVFIQQGNFQEAREMLESIKDTSQRIKVLSELGLATARANQKQESQQIWQEIRDLLPSIEEELILGHTFVTRSPIYQRVEGLSTFGRAMALANEKQEAFQIWQEARKLIQALTDSPSKVEELGKLGQAMALANYEQEAIQVWQEAQALISTLKGYSEKVAALGILGQAMAQANLEQQAWQVWQEAQAIIASTDKRIFECIIESFESLGATDSGGAPRGRIEAAPRELPLKRLRKISQELAGDYQLQRNQEEASAIIEAVGEVMITIYNSFLGQEEYEGINVRFIGRMMGVLLIGISSNSISAPVLSGFSEVLAKARHWQEAREVLMTIEDYPRWQDNAWYALASSLAQAERWQEAYEAATSIEDSKRITILKGMARDLAQKKQWQEAWKMLAAIEDGEERTEALHELSSAVMQFYNEIHLEVVKVYFHHVREQDISPEQEKLEVLRAEVSLQLLTLLLQVWTAVTTSEEALAAFPLVHGFVQRDPELGKALAQSFTWVADFLKHGDEVSL